MFGQLETAKKDFTRIHHQGVSDVLCVKQSKQNTVMMTCGQKILKKTLLVVTQM